MTGVDQPSVGLPLMGHRADRRRSAERHEKSCRRDIPDADGDVVSLIGTRAFRLRDPDDFAFMLFEPFVDIVFQRRFDKRGSTTADVGEHLDAFVHCVPLMVKSVTAADASAVENWDITPLPPLLRLGEGDTETLPDPIVYKT